MTGRARWKPIVLAIALGLAAAFVTASPRTRPLLQNTLWLALGAIAISLPVGTALAWLAYRTNAPGAAGFRWLLTALLFLPPYLQVAGWDAGFGLQGWFPRWWSPGQVTAPLTGWRAAILLHGVIAIPWVTLLVGLGLRRIPRELEELALLEGRTAQVLWHISLRWSAPLIVAAAVWTLVLTAGEITITDLYQIRTFAEEIYTGFALGDSLAAAHRRALPGGLLIASLSIGVLWIAHVFTDRFLLVGYQRPLQFDLGGARWVASGILLLAVLLLLAVPLANLVFKAGLEVQQWGATRVRSWSPQKFLATVLESPSRFREEFFWSTMLAQGAALGALMCAFPWAWKARGSRFAAVAGWSLTALILAIPAPLLALALGRIIHEIQADWLFYLYDRTLFLPWLVLLLRSFPCAFILATITVRQIDPSLLSLARVDGAATGWPLLRWLVPLLTPALALVWMITLALALGDLSASILAVPPGVTTIAIRVFNLMHYGVEDQLAGLCLWTTVLFVGLTAITLQLVRLSQRSREPIV